MNKRFFLVLYIFAFTLINVSSAFSQQSSEVLTQAQTQRQEVTGSNRDTTKITLKK